MENKVYACVYIYIDIYKFFYSTGSYNFVIFWSKLVVSKAEFTSRPEIGIF